MKAQLHAIRNADMEFERVEVDPDACFPVFGHGPHHHAGASKVFCRAKDF